MSNIDDLKTKFEVFQNALQDGPKRVKKAVDLSDLSNIGSRGDADKVRSLEGPALDVIRGVACAKILEPLPRYRNAPCEKVIAGKNNSYIVLGRDRDKSLLSGFGGEGHTKAGSIDIVVGRLGSNTAYKAKGKKITAEPDFEKDSARIYISQKSNIDEYFSLVSTANAALSEKRASIGMKADTIRIIGRESVRIVTEGPGFNSMGGARTSVGGIDLVAGNRDAPPYDDVQPLVKGKNLVKALTEIAILIDELRSTLAGFVTEQQEFNTAVQNHTHNSPFFSLPTAPAGACLTQGLTTTMNIFQNTTIGLKNQGFNLEAFKKNYLSPAIINPVADPDSESSTPDPNYILSRFNGTN